MSRIIMDTYHQLRSIVTKNDSLEEIWDGSVKNKIYNPDTLEWEAQTGSSDGGITTTPATTKTTLVDEASGTVMYVGKADIGSSQASAVWQIKKVSVSGTVTTTTYADGNGSYDNIWNNRASLSYS